MTAVIDQVKNVAYTSVGVNLLVTDAIVGHKVTAPEFAGEYATIARKQATEALTHFRARTEPRAVKFEARLPEQVATAMASNRTKAWKFIGINAPKVPSTATSTATRTASTTAAPTAARKATRKATRKAAPKAKAAKKSTATS